MSGQENGKREGAVVSLFQGTGAHADVEHADNRTLRLSVPGLTPDKVRALIAFQRQWITELRAHPSEDQTASAKAYDKVAGQSGLTIKEANELEALARAFAGDAWTLRTLKARLAEARAAVKAAEVQGTAPAPRDLLAVEKLPREILTREASSAAEKRYGAEVIAVLREFEDELIALHLELNALLRR